MQVILLRRVISKVLEVDYPFLYDNATEFITAKPGHRSIFNTFSSDTTLKVDQIKYSDVIQCLWCFTDRGFMSDEGCYSVYYEYKKITDWDYHNKRIQIPIAGMQLICKTCETRGRDALTDDKCRFGSIDDYVVCGRNQVCYVNHDEESDFVTRGCINTPAYNSMFYLCNNSLCNSKPFNIPKIRSEQLLLNDMSHNHSIHTKSTGVTTPKVKNLLPNFRRQVEEIPEEFTKEKSEDDSNINLVAFLVKNAKEIFGETYDNTDVVTKSSEITEGTTFRQETTSLKDRRTLPVDRTFFDENTFLEERPALEERTILKEKTITEEKIWPKESTFPLANIFTERVSSTDEETFNKEGMLHELVTSSVPFPEKTLFAVKPSKNLLRDLTNNTITDFTTVWSPSLTNPFGTISSTTTTTTTSIPYSISSNSYSENPTTQSYKLPTRTTGIYYTINVESIKSELLNITNVQIIEKGKNEPIMLTRKQDHIHDDISIYNVPVAGKEMASLKRSCVVCNNIQMHECNEPKNKMLPHTRCENEEDLCYTQQTPFGLIDRGCFNVNQNITTYVCSCNLCNYIPISDMPYKFSKRKDWLDNIIDISRTRDFRSSIFKNMSCLSCEVNYTSPSSILLEHINCQDGNIGMLPKVQCADDEICGVKALKNKGYVWRGCLRSPLYNYWWSLCDSDLCNTDNIVSLYDEIR
ncbi:uncharacterized protein LOC106711354 [Papilio machaon]|uniref:uncharacterized protein LOC106711354 n=1 Tax=Papilio machaon TaxID=76193 RepID=UPI001E665083|nr:uncharacterized protein LOC106711354 [Papilio machaon]